jgi:hypothetical protein
MKGFVFYITVFVILVISCANFELSGVWEYKPTRLIQKRSFSWGEQAYSALGTLNIDLNAKEPYISGGGIGYWIKDISYSKSRITITINDWLDENVDKVIVIEVLDKDTILIREDLFYGIGSGKVYKRVPVDAKYEPLTEEEKLHPGFFQ